MLIKSPQKHVTAQQEDREFLETFVGQEMKI